jgi:hypothetical protein
MADALQIEWFREEVTAQSALVAAKHKLEEDDEAFHW